MTLRLGMVPSTAAGFLWKEPMDEVPEKSNISYDLSDDIRFSSESVAGFVLLKILCDFDRRADAAFLIEKLVDLMYDGTDLSGKDDVD